MALAFDLIFDRPPTVENQLVDLFDNDTVKLFNGAMAKRIVCPRSWTSSIQSTPETWQTTNAQLATGKQKSLASGASCSCGRWDSAGGGGNLVAARRI